MSVSVYIRSFMLTAIIFLNVPNNSFADVDSYEKDIDRLIKSPEDIDKCVVKAFNDYQSCLSSKEVEEVCSLFGPYREQCIHYVYNMNVNRCGIIFNNDVAACYN